MSKYSIIAVIFAFVIIALIPASARDINLGDTVYIGEQHLNLTNALLEAYVNEPWRATSNDYPAELRYNSRVCWWRYGPWRDAGEWQGSAFTPDGCAPISDSYMDFTVERAYFQERTGKWYVADKNLQPLRVFFIVEDPTPITTVPTTVPTTAVPTTVPTTTVPTIVPTTTVPTTVPTTVLTTIVTTATPDPVIKLLEEQNKKIEEQNKKLEELNKTISQQSQELAEQTDVLTQIINFFKNMFGWK